MLPIQETKEGYFRGASAKLSKYLNERPLFDLKITKVTQWPTRKGTFDFSRVFAINDKKNLFLNLDLYLEGGYLRSRPL